MKFTYENLNTTPQIYEMIKMVYQISNYFPNSEKFGLTNQLRRSSTSVLLNIAEGSSRYSPKEFARFTNIAIGSLVETDATIKLGKSLGYLKENTIALDELIQELYFKLVALRKSLLRNKQLKQARGLYRTSD